MTTQFLDVLQLFRGQWLGPKYWSQALKTMENVSGWLPWFLVWTMDSTLWTQH